MKFINLALLINYYRLQTLLYLQLVYSHVIIRILNV